VEKLPTLGDTPEHAWMLEFLERCFPESGGRANADLHMALAMCKAEPKYAQVAMQWLAQEIRSRRRDESGAVFLRFALGVLFTAYAGVAHAEGRCGLSGLPPELETPVRLNPEIVACANELGPLKFGA
jgi:hypothetical protein